MSVLREVSPAGNSSGIIAAETVHSVAFVRNKGGGGGDFATEWEMTHSRAEKGTGCVCGALFY
jgi:hypothetical protein